MLKLPFGNANSNYIFEPFKTNRLNVMGRFLPGKFAGNDGNNSVGFLFLHKDTTYYIKLRSQLIGLLSSVVERAKRSRKSTRKAFAC